MYREQTIEQLIPATGWAAVYALDTGPELHWQPVPENLVCWALILTSTGFQRVVGMVRSGDHPGEIRRAAEEDGFLGYAPIGTDLTRFIPDAARYGAQVRWVGGEGTEGDVDA